MGRSFLTEEDRPGGKNVVMVSHGLWISKLGGPRDVIGQSITLDSRDCTVIGVLPANFTFALLGRNIDVWAPRVTGLSLVTPQQMERGTMFLTAVGRLRPGVTIEKREGRNGRARSPVPRDLSRPPGCRRRGS